MKKFPDIKTFAWKSTKTQKWNTKVQRSGSGRVRTMTTWKYPQWEITAQFAYLTTEQYKTIMGFVASIKGGNEPFLWYDPEDNTEKGVQLSREDDGGYIPVRKIGEYIEPVEYVEDLKVYVNGKETKAEFHNGKIYIEYDKGKDATVTADYKYYWKVMFSDSKYSMEYVFTNFYKTKSFKVVTVR